MNIQALDITVSHQGRQLSVSIFITPIADTWIVNFHFNRGDRGYFRDKLDRKTLLHHLVYNFDQDFTFESDPIDSAYRLIGRNLDSSFELSISDPELITEAERIRRIMRSTESLSVYEPYLLYGDPEAKYNKENYVTVPVLFATDRKRTDSTKFSKYYGNERGDCLSYGECNVSVPEDHIIGKIERPNAWRQIFGSNPAKDMSILKLQSLGSSDFINQIKENIGTSGVSDLLIFVHGYNSGFQETVIRTAQLRHDLAFKGSAIAFSWTSQDSMTGYTADMDGADIATKNLMEILENFIGAGINKINIIAHSMGNKVVGNCLEKLSLKGIAPKGLINHIIMAAPDVDAQVFEQVTGPSVIKLGKSITLYAASNDFAMKISKFKRTNIPRAGDARSILIIDGIDTIDATKVNKSLIGHSYFGDSRELINDIFHILHSNLTPDKRQLTPINIDRGLYWEFPA